MVDVEGTTRQNNRAPWLLVVSHVLVNPRLRSVLVKVKYPVHYGPVGIKGRPLMSFGVNKNGEGICGHNLSSGSLSNLRCFTARTTTSYGQLGF